MTSSSIMANKRQLITQPISSRFWVHLSMISAVTSPLAVSKGAWLIRRALGIFLITTAASAFTASSSVRRTAPFARWQKQRTTGPARYISDVSIESAGDGELIDDDALLNTVPKEQLVHLCDQCRISNEGTKQELLQRLRDHAAAEAEAARQRSLARLQRVEEGSEDSKERYEIVSDEPDEDAVDDEGFFFFELPTAEGDERHTSETSQGREAPRTVITRDAVTAPPPPLEANADGERVVTVYSTSEQNDLTAIAASQPGRGASFDALSNSVAASSSSSTQPQAWDMQRTSETTLHQLEKAKEQVLALVATLLEMTGAPGFASLDGDDEVGDNVSYAVAPRGRKQQNGLQFVGFNPGKVPADLLTAHSQALRAGRGQVLQDVLRQFELQAIGQDGMAGDKAERGGGHYREVTKVRAFLEGFRRAEVRRIARETTVLLLDKLVLEGVEGLDLTLNTMVRSSDDTTDYAGALNDSLLDFLNDAIRQQEKKVDELFGPRRVAEKAAERTLLMEDEYDPIERLWDVTNEDGQRVETLDPNDPEVKRILEVEVSKASLARQAFPSSSVPDSAPEKLLLLLTLLRERIKVEAAFAPDEKGRNLRLLAYCLRVWSQVEREQLMLKDIGNSLDRLDSFIELVASSIEYGESTSYELQPAKKQFLNVPQLRRILELSEDLRRRQTVKASGLRP